jgi:hypothetical protein
MTAIPSCYRLVVADSAGSAFSPGWLVIAVMALAAGIAPV